MQAGCRGTFEMKSSQVVESEFRRVQLSRGELIYLSWTRKDSGISGTLIILGASPATVLHRNTCTPRSPSSPLFLSNHPLLYLPRYKFPKWSILSLSLSLKTNHSPSALRFDSWGSED